MVLKSIDTKYGGCEFRSRLEARYAVLFDTLGIVWEYEPQGYEVTKRLECSDETFRYLPDFWLPDLKVWFEVKGEIDTISTDRLLNAAASLSSNNGGDCHDRVAPGVASTLLDGIYCKAHSSNASTILAIDAARTARFEHGRNGSRRRARDRP